MASADSEFDGFFYSVFNLNNKNVNALVARELSGFTSTRSIANNDHEIFKGTEISRSLFELV